MDETNLFIRRSVQYKNQETLRKVFGFQVPLDGLLMMAGQRVYVDIIKLDKLFSYYDNEYNCIDSLYKGQPCSMSEYVTQKFGKKNCDLLETLL